MRQNLALPMLAQKRHCFAGLDQKYLPQKTLAH
jgi:hypothetical protein